MKTLSIKAIICASVVLMGLSSCSSTYRTMQEANTRVNFEKQDFTFSGQVTGEGKSVKVFSIDWIRLFSSKKMGSVGNNVSVANIPVIGGIIGDRTMGYALYDLMENNPGYDVVFYPQYKTKISKPFLGLGLLYKKTTVEATARLGKIN